jgi:hypothetical protein
MKTQTTPRILVTRTVLNGALATLDVTAGLRRDTAIGVAGRALEGTTDAPAWFSPPMSLAAVGALVAALALDA